MYSHPLVVDLDGTLLHTDTLHESALQLLRDRPADTLRIPGWLAQGKAAMKRRIAALTQLNPETLPYNQALLNWLKEQRASGRTLILCTATDRAVAEPIAAHLGLFDEVMASEGEVNLAGANKAEALRQRFGDKGFDYAGNSSADLAVWAHARESVVVNAPTALLAQARERFDVTKVFEAPERGFTTWRRALRLHQWLKNLLLFMPLLAAHQLGNGHAWGVLALAFLSFSLCASSVYLANDLLDLESDRLHPRKRARPFASGVLPVWIGVALAPVLLAVSLGLASLVGAGFMIWLVVYFVLTCLYSWLLKRLILVDCLTLAMLYTLRVLAGAAAVGLELSFWLLAFSVFLFLSLAFVKRFAELELQRSTGRAKLHGRGYHTDDASLIQTMGITAGQASVLVLALYLNSDAVTRLYAHPQLIWGAVPVMLFWVHWMWMQAHRGKMHDDPLVFAVKDRASLAAGVGVALFLAAGALGSPVIKVSGWGRLSAAPHRVVPLPDRAGVAELLRTEPGGIAHGMGRSYGDAALNGGGLLWSTRTLDRLIDFDPSSGILRCEAGVQLLDIQRLFVPRGWMLAVSPGTQLVTVGGAIANDVHGKNHHRVGSFGDHVRRLALQRGDGELIECGPALRPEWFAATVGGIGLTGVILWAELQLRPVAGPWLETESHPYGTLDEFFALNAASEAEWEYTVSWIDCLSASVGKDGRARARGLFMRGNHSTAGSGPLPRAGHRRVPFTPPIPLINGLSLRAFNSVYYGLGRLRAGASRQHYQPFFYPLDSLHDWNRIYGPRGFHQYQCVIPGADGPAATQAMLGEISRSGRGSFLAVLKTFGERHSRGLLGFPRPGVTLALDFADDGAPLERLFQRLDAVVAEAGGRLYLAKDARMPRALFESGYPKHAEFRSFRDPGLTSEMSRRLLGD